MKLKDLRDAYYTYSGKTSDIVRQLGFAGIAVVWVFKISVGDKQSVPPELLPAAFLIVAGLTLDLLHYIAGSLMWGIYNAIKESKRTQEDTEFTVPVQINWPTLFFFWSKTLVMVVAYGFILHFLYHTLT